jgi:hypothetical protein
LIKFIQVKHCTFFILFFFASFRESRASDSLAVSTALVIRSQLQSIADEAVEQAKFDSSGQVALWVEGEEPRLLAENAFLETLQKKGYTSVLHEETSKGQSLHVFLLRSDCKVQQLDNKYFEREIHTALEARTMIGTDRKVHVLGTYHRESKDTAQVFPSVQISGVHTVEEENLMQQLLTPIILICGAALIIYLLFTVRS